MSDDLTREHPDGRGDSRRRLRPHVSVCATGSHSHGERGHKKEDGILSLLPLVTPHPQMLHQHQRLLPPFRLSPSACQFAFRVEAFAVANARLVHSHIFL